MDHLCNLDEISIDYKKLRNGQVMQIIWSSRKEDLPYKYLFCGDRIYFFSQKYNTLLSTTVRGVNTLRRTNKKSLKNKLINYDPSLTTLDLKKLLKHKYFIFISFEPVIEVTDYYVDTSFFLENTQWMLSSKALIEKENNKTCQ